MPTDNDNLSDLFQQRLEQWEAGTPLSDCLQDLSPDDAATFQLAIEIRSLPMPTRSEDNILLLRAQLQRQVASQPRPMPQPATNGLTALQQWWRQRQPRTRLALAMILPLAIFALWFTWQAGVQPAQIANNQPAATLAPATNPTTNETPETAVSSQPQPTNPETTVGSAAPIISASYRASVPIPTLPVSRSADTATFQLSYGIASLQIADNQWETAAATLALASGQRIRTGSQSSATLTFYDGSIATLGPNTDITISELNALRPEDGFRTVALTQWTGTSSHQVQFRNDGGSRYEVSGPNATGIARGTVFNVAVSDSGAVRYAVQEGRVDVSAANITVRLDAGETTTVPTDAPPATATFAISGSGELTAITPTENGENWTIGGQTFLVTPNTTLLGSPQPGDWVMVEGHLASNGAQVADIVTVTQPTAANDFTLTGIVDAISPETIVVSGQSIAITTTTDLPADPIAVGDNVRVSGTILDGGNLLATAVTPIDPDIAQPFTFTGVVQAISDDIWTISGTAVAITPDTDIADGITSGDLVQVSGEILEGDIWVAQTITRVDSSDSATFLFTGPVQSIDPWIVAGIPFSTTTSTTIDPTITLDDIVEVSGTILPDGTWTATSITAVADTYLFRIIGIVNSIDPWIINGIAIPATAATTITPSDIAPGDLAMAEIVLLADGEWQVLTITKLSGDDIVGCFTVTTIITSVSDQTLTLRDWQPVTLTADTVVTGDLLVGSVITLHLCATSTGDIQVVAIDVLQPPLPIATPTPTPGDDNDDDNDDNGTITDHKVTICHLPGGDAAKGRTISIDQSAVDAHLGHGDTIGSCP